ncbi:hypothetical protein MRX96_028643 [Rhipicephalus microplus]
MIPCNLHNAIIGAKGRLIHSIMEDCGRVPDYLPPAGLQERPCHPQRTQGGRRQGKEAAAQPVQRKAIVQLHRGSPCAA